MKIRGRKRRRKNPARGRSVPKNPLRYDPSRTAGLRRKFAAELRRRFSRLRLKVWRLIVEEDAFGLRSTPTTFYSFTSNVTVNNRWRFLPKPDQIQAFRVWLRSQVQQDILGSNGGGLWKAYAEAGFRRGAGRAFDDVTRRRGRWSPGEGDFYKGSKEQFLRDSFARPVAVEKVKILAGRTYNDLEGVTEAMSSAMTRTLTDGLVRGLSPRDIAIDMNENVDGIGRRRAMVISHDSIIAVHAEGQLQAMEDLGVEEVGAAVEFSTAGDDRVCLSCSALEGVVLKLDEARGMIPVHNFCRCAWLPANVGEDDADQKKSKRAIDKAVRYAQSQVGDEEDEEGGEWGPGEDIAKERPRSIFNSSPALDEFSRFLVNAGGRWVTTEDDQHVWISDKGELHPSGPDKPPVKSHAPVKPVRIATPTVVKPEKPPIKSPGPVEPVPSIVAKPEKPPVKSEPPVKTEKPSPAKESQGGRTFTTPEEAEDHFDTTHKTTLNKGKMSDAEFTKTATAVDGTYTRLGDDFKAARDTLKKRRPQSLKLGEDFGDSTIGIYRYGEGIRLSNLKVDPKAVPQFGNHNIGGDLESVLRHEFGHEVFDMGFSSAKKKDWNSKCSKYVGTNTVSRYGGTNINELFCESFSAYTSSNYKRGSLPDDIETWLDKNVKE